MRVKSINKSVETCSARVFSVGKAGEARDMISLEVGNAGEARDTFSLSVYMVVTFGLVPRGEGGTMTGDGGMRISCKTAGDLVGEEDGDSSRGVASSRVVDSWLWPGG